MTIRQDSPEAAILSFIQSRGGASAIDIGAACRMTPGDVRRRLVTLESARLVSGRYDTSTTPRRLYFITAEGAREVEP